jgi:hypothetical protein
MENGNDEEEERLNVKIISDNVISNNNTDILEEYNIICNSIKYICTQIIHNIIIYK